MQVETRLTDLFCRWTLPNKNRIEKKIIITDERFNTLQTVFGAANSVQSKFRAISIERSAGSPIADQPKCFQSTQMRKHIIFSWTQGEGGGG
jgi:hypothetical protein